ncbi:Uncharacterized [Moorella glycerini]|uniref:Uncharacterized protein n=1 Tax=Neomoorella stamsii TaxID=1266720 RepID=A0A9X7J008_9FIRM|nr:MULTISPECIES: hypothetical protein [Moorella]PRR68838.1 hypothetical protein MOST_31200 [Moorella stamsii]CEP67459.1 Uncharacterized [Moorella glycerini]
MPRNLLLFLQVIIVTTIFLTSLFCLGGCSATNTIPQPEDILFDAKVYSFNSVCKYRSYFGLINYGRSDDEYQDEMKQAIEVAVFWELRPQKRLEDENKLYYPPYILIIPDREYWTYAGTMQSVNKLHTVISLPYDIIDNVLKDYPEYNWVKNSEERFAWVLHATSFEQGFTSLAFRKRSNSGQPQPFKIYFIYYDPVLKKGWAKSLEVASPSS